MRLLTAVLLALSLFISPVIAQQRTPGNVWTLQHCVQYAIAHNITIRQDSLNARLARYTLRQSELSQIPSLNATGSFGRSYGRSINPTTNQFVDATYDFLGPSASSNVLLFGWLQTRNTIARNKYSLEAALADLDQRRDDIALNVANGYLAALLAQEQINVTRNQVDVSMALLNQTRAFADAGRLPELNVAQQESQLATDSANLINAIASYNSSILDLKTLLNIDFGENMVLEAPVITADDQLQISVSQPEEIFLTARSHFGTIKGNQLRVAAAAKGVAVAKGALYPQLSLSYQIGTNYASNFQRVASYGDTLVAPTSNFWMFNNDRVPVFQYYQLPNIENTPFGDQLKNNVRQSVVLNLNVPIFNSWQSQYAIRQAKINLASAELTEYNAELTLKQSVYKAHNDAVNAVHRYNAAKRAGDAARRALDFAKKRYDLGLTSTVDLLVTKNSDFAAASNLVGAKYQLLFRLKVIEYYQGKELKL